MTLEFKDSEGRTARYTTKTWIDGGSTLTTDETTHYRVDGSNAGPGQITVLTLKNR
ncbi:hypothetical protein [Streptomyces sp. NPDC096030]|uniref:hypothetical protein n=1 Tax=Streptomyces sp. NPDC096030 TaxID=3155423 RepID=UPI0033232345